MRVPDLSQHFTTSLVLFDGVCALCSRTVQFLLKKDRHQILKFAALQGQTAKTIFARHPLIKNNLKSVIYIREYNSQHETLYFRSQAILEILEDIEGFERPLFFLRLIPGFLRDTIYGLLARFRYRWFGKYEQCWLPNPKWTERFLP